MNGTLKKYFSKEEFNSIINSEKLYWKNSVCKELRRRKVYCGHRKTAPGAPEEPMYDEKIDYARLINLLFKGENLWFIGIDNVDGITDDKIDNLGSGARGLQFLGVGNEYGKLKPLSKSLMNKVKLNIGNYLHNDFTLEFVYLKDKSNDKFVIEKWRHCCSDRHSSSFVEELKLSEKEILDQYYKK